MLSQHQQHQHQQSLRERHCQRKTEAAKANGGARQAVRWMGLSDWAGPEHCGSPVPGHSGEKLGR